MSQLAAKHAPDGGLSRRQPDAVHPAGSVEFGRICTSLCELAAGVFTMPQVLLKVYQGNVLEIAATVGLPDDHIIDDLSFLQRKLISGESLLVHDVLPEPHRHQHG